MPTNDLYQIELLKFDCVAERISNFCLAHKLILTIMLYSHIQLHVYIYKYTLHAETSLTINDDFNKRTNTLLYKNINPSHFIFERMMFALCEKWVETRTDCYIDPSSSSPIAALLLHLGLGCSTVGHWGPEALCLELVLTLASCFQLTQTVWAPGYIIV